MGKIEKRFIEGNDAMVAGAIAAGARFYAGYPISPSSEVAKGAAAELPKYGGIYIQMEDEISSMAALLGASLAGKKAFTATSGPGVSLMHRCCHQTCSGRFDAGPVWNARRSQHHCSGSFFCPGLL